MAASALCLTCRPIDFSHLGIMAPPAAPAAPAHCYGYGDRAPTPGVLGGFRCSCSCRPDAKR